MNDTNYYKPNNKNGIKCDRYMCTWLYHRTYIYTMYDKGEIQQLSEKKGGELYPNPQQTFFAGKTKHGRV